jgi:thiol:disulfide interchange protein DsbD
MKYIIYVIALMVSQSSTAAEEIPEDIVTIQENSVKVQKNESQTEMILQLKIKDGFFAYKEKFEVNIKGFKSLDIKLDPIVTFFDQTFQKTKEGVRTQATLSFHPQLQGKTVPETLAIDVVYQACTPEYCLFPTTTSLKYVLKQDERKLLSQTASVSGLFSKGLFLSFFFVFIAGFLTSLTPCIYPMLPITLAVLGAKKSQSKMDGLFKSSIYVFGMAFTYAVLGVLAATSGFMFGSLLSNSYFLVFLSLILFVAALSMFDVFEIQTPQFLNNRIGNQGRSKSVAALFGAGLFSGLIVGPCVGPVLVSILGYVSQTGSVLLGFGLLFTFALGLGSLIILAGTFSSVFEKIPRAGAWMIWVKKMIGIAFLGLILYFLSPLLKTRDLFLIACAVGFLFSLILLIKDWKVSSLRLVERAVWRSVMVLFLLLYFAVASMTHERFERLVGYDGADFANTHWALYSEESLRLAAAHQDFVVLDFYAEWCAACRELKHKTFSDPRVSAYSSKIKWFYFDSTQATDELTALKKKYGILGLPTILFFDSQGKWREDLTLTGFEDADSFLKRLDQLTGGQK